MQIFFLDFLRSGFNNSITTSIFPSSLKQAIITPVFKKGDKNLKENYRPVSILPNVLKVFERLLFKQISNFMEPFFSKQQCGFHKDYSSQYCFLYMLEKWKSVVDKRKIFWCTFDRFIKSLRLYFTRTYTCKTTCVWF